VVWPTPRFTDNGNGTVTDNLTGLIWLKNANCYGLRSWVNALDDCNSLAAPNCGLSDGSSAGDWHLPNRKELLSLIDLSQYNPALPSGNPFSAVIWDQYWSSSTYAFSMSYAWRVGLHSALVSTGNKTTPYYVWPVRGAQ